MDYKIRIISYLYYFSLAGLFFIYLFPGSIFGYFLYGDLKQQPHIMSNPFGISINHFIAFFYLSLVGLISCIKDKKFKFMIFFLITISIVLEISHIFIPIRSFQFVDLVGNLLGTVTAIVIIFVFKRIKNGKV